MEEQAFDSSESVNEFTMGFKPKTPPASSWPYQGMFTPVTALIYL